MTNHSHFILSPISNILRDIVSASAGVGSGIETFPLCDYAMQSVFLRMTGYQEQKLKCICWDLAANDYEFRYEFTKKPLGECSSYKDKAAIYKDLVEQIKKHFSAFNTPNGIDRDRILSETVREVTDIFAKTNLAIWTQRSFIEFTTIWRGIKKKHFATDNNILLAEINNGVSLRTIFDNHLYKQRNRVAHNTQSYQQNLPTLKKLLSEDHIFENYFIWFAILVLIDKTFVALFEKYLQVINY